MLNGHYKTWKQACPAYHLIVRIGRIRCDALAEYPYNGHFYCRLHHAMLMDFVRQREDAQAMKAQAKGAGA